VLNNHLAEHEIEKLVILSFNPEENANKVEHIAECEVCKKKYDYFVSFYKTLEQELSKGDNYRIESLLKNNLRERIFELTYYEPKANYFPTYEKENNLVLAAKSKNIPTIRFQKQAVFINEQENMMIRIMYDVNERKYLLFMHSETEGTNEKFNVKFISSVGSFLNVPVENCKAELPLSEAPDWSKVKIFVNQIES